MRGRGLRLRGQVARAGPIRLCRTLHRRSLQVDGSPGWHARDPRPMFGLRCPPAWALDGPGQNRCVGACSNIRSRRSCGFEIEKGRAGDDPLNPPAAVRFMQTAIGEEDAPRILQELIAENSIARC